MFGQSFVFGSIAGGAAPITVDYLAIGGGGSGNLSYGGNQYVRYDGGGGGAGQVTETSSDFFSGTTYTVTIGSSNTATTIQGADISTITAIAGGAGGTSFAGTATVYNGGSGGGAGVHSGNVTGGLSLSGQGNGGNYVGTNYSPITSAGGGGMVGNGGNNSGAGGAGGTVTLYDSTAATALGISTTVAGGGGGAQENGGSGGGGRGGRVGFYHASPGSANTGSGGGGAEGDGGLGSVNAGAGGSGLVVFKIPTASWSGSTTGSPSITTSGSDTLIAFKASGTITF